MKTATKNAWSQANRKRVPHHECGPTKTQQQFKDQCDINQILKKYRDTNAAPTHVARIQGTFGDFTNAMDYQTSLNKIMEAKEQFMALPSAVRKRFANDPTRLVAFVNDPKNKDEAFDLGLLNETAGKAVSEAREAAKLAAQDAKDRQIADLQAQLKNTTKGV